MEELAVKVGLSPAAISQKERGELAFRRQDVAKFARAFEMEPEDLLHLGGAQDAKPTLERRIPIINRAPGGAIVDFEHLEFTTCEEDHRWWKTVDRGDIREENAFGVEVLGDSMQPALFEGDIAIFVPLDEEAAEHRLKPGKIILAFFGPDSHAGRGCTIARWEPLGDGRGRLNKDNAKHVARVVTTGQGGDLASIALFLERRTRRDR